MNHDGTKHLILTRSIRDNLRNQRETETGTETGMSALHHKQRGFSNFAGLLFNFQTFEPGRFSWLACRNHMLSLPRARHLYSLAAQSLSLSNARALTASKTV